MSTKEKREKSSKQKKQDGIALAIWFLAMLIIVVLFIIYWPEISKNINAQIEKRNKTEQNSSQETSQTQIPQEEQQEQITIDLNDDSSEDAPVEKFSPKESEPKTEQIPSQTKEPQNIQEVQKEEPVSKPIEAKRKLTLYFVAIDSDGSIVRKPVVKTVPKTDSPLTDAIKNLLAGPDASDKVRTLIPSGTKLIGASVKNGIATLNFNEAFVFNQNFGNDGYSAQLQQIVYTATEFSTVNSVQFLIEGEKKDFLVEGLWIGSPLSRANF